MKTIAEETPILPHILADVVCRELDSILEMPHPVTSDFLADKADIIYQHNPVFRKKVKSSRGRDYLYAFMRHWAAAKLSCTMRRKLPRDYSDGTY